MPFAVGIGLLALDVVVDEHSDESIGKWAGGSCGNVMAILAHLGWEAAPIGRLEKRSMGKLVRADLERWGVSQRWLSLQPWAPAPIYVQRLQEGRDGATYHRFERFCPACGSRLPGYRAVTRNAIEAILEEVAECDVLYVDRPSAGAVSAARAVRENGGLILFEPSARGELRQLSELARLADIVKYSSERLNEEDREAIEMAAPTAEIETMGERGLRYRTGKKWHSLSAPSVAVRDSAGAGDWTTAGLLHALRGRTPQRGLNAASLRDVLDFAQALGAVSCRYLGARGAMEEKSSKQLLEAARRLQASRGHGIRRHGAGPRTAAGRFSCADCG